MIAPELDLELKSVEVVPSRRLKILGFSLDYQAVKSIFLAFIITRIMIFFIIFISSSLIPMNAGQYLYSNPSNVVLDGLIRNDSWWYQNIVTKGYTMGNLKTGAQGNTAFFPFYPLTVKMIAAVTGDVFLAGIIVSNLAFIIALSYMYGLVKRQYDTKTASRTLFYFAAAPTAFIFSSMYTESLFMLFVAATFYHSSRAQWDRAALFGALASATRNTGVLLALVILFEGFSFQGVRFLPPSFKRKEILVHYWSQLRLVLKGWRSIVAAAFVPVGLFGYMAYLSNTFGDPLGFIHVQATWGREVNGAGFTKIVDNTIKNLSIGSNLWAGQINVGVLIDLLFTLGFLPLVIMVVRRMRPAWAIFTILTYLIPLSTGSVGSMARYSLMLFPCFILLAQWGRKEWVDRLVLGLFLPGLCYFSIIFSHWYFTG